MSDSNYFYLFFCLPGFLVHLRFRKKHALAHLLELHVYSPDISTYCRCTAMSGSPDWKPTFSARPSSVTDKKSSMIVPSKAEMSPSSFDLSGRNVRPKLDPKAAASHILACRTAESPASGNSADEAGSRSRSPRVFICGVEAMPPGAPTSSRGPAPTQASVPSIASVPRSDSLLFRPFSIGNGPPFIPAPQAMWPGGIFRPGWCIGAWFRCLIRRGLHHCVYEGPPDGTPRVRLSSEEVLVDFNRPYRIKALFCNSTFSAVQFKVMKTYSDGTTSSMKVWTNVRRDNDWWAEIVDASIGMGSLLERTLPLDYPEHSEEGGTNNLIVITKAHPSRRNAPAPKTSAPAPAEEAN